MELGDAPLPALLLAVLQRVCGVPAVQYAAAAVATLCLLWAAARVLGVGPYKRASLQGRAVVVTGAAAGLGRALALSFAQQGARLVLWDIDAEGLKETARLVGDSVVLTQEVDVTKREAVYTSAARAVRACGGSVYCLVNNAGLLGGRPLLKAEDDRIVKVFEVNSLSLFWTTKAFLPRMISQGSGFVVTIASGAGLVGVANSIDYSASKHAARGFTDSLRLELKKHSVRNIGTLCVFPGVVDTAMAKGYYLPGVPVLTAASVADSVVDAVRLGKRNLYLPFTTLLGLYNSVCMPADAFDTIGNWFGASNVADNWDPSQQDAVYAKLKQRD